MGMSAGQARLLSITARMTDNELRSQMITNSKLRLADKSSEASAKYMDALNSQQLMYASYNDNGEKTLTALTPNVLTSYSDMKNQYAMVNSSGQILVSGTDAKNFENCSTLNDFLALYDTTDPTDPKYQWYTNLWYRMGGTDGVKTSNDTGKYKEIDPDFLNSTEWLQFALENGIVTLEQVQFTEDGSQEYPNMGTYDWVSISYNNASDITSQDNEIAIAKAEVKYKNEMQEIENQDKKYDQDLKKLDTEHSALQTEYESVKSVIDKNVERSFKAFS